MDRRTLLVSGGVVATAAVVAACGSDGGQTAATAESTPAQATDAPAAPAAGAVASTSDIPVGGGVILDEPAVVITQPSEGEFKAFVAICPHQGCLVSEVVANEIICPCHGSRFSGTDGAVLEGPSRQGLTAAGVAVEGGSVVLS